MFIAVALMCLDMNLGTCSQMLWQETFLTSEACDKHIDGMIGQIGPKGTIVYASCFKVEGLGEPV